MLKLLILTLALLGTSLLLPAFAAVAASCSPNGNSTYAVEAGAVGR